MNTLAQNAQDAQNALIADYELQQGKIDALQTQVDTATQHETDALAAQKQKFADYLNSEDAADVAFLATL